MSTPKPLPRIACFHGGGSNSAIFSVQCESLQRLLSTKFEFVFFDAPFTRSAGPGILPYFTEEKFGPYRTWFCNTGSEDGRDEEGKSESGIERVVRMIKEKGGEGEWVGCMGFSQGTRVVGGLLLEQMRLRQLGVPGLGLGVESGDLDLGIMFRFGVLCMGGGAPMLSEMSYRKISKVPPL
jgi:predicted esterase